MKPMARVECTSCGGKYYVMLRDANLQLPYHIRPGEAFPNSCPICVDGDYAIINEEQGQ